jgi:hypothetical protein
MEIEFPIAPPRRPRGRERWTTIDRRALARAIL